MHRIVVTETEQQTRALGRELAEHLKAGNLVAMSGELGTGKTVLVRGICEHFQCEQQVSSPTFTIENEYKGTATLVHCDLYRVKSIAEMLDIGLDEVFTGNGIILVEWAERAKALLPLPRLEIRCEHGEMESQRKYTIADVQNEADSILLVNGTR